MTVVIHASADVSDKAKIGEGTIIWHQAQIRERAVIGRHCVIGKGVYIDADVSIGNNVKIQNYVSVYRGVTIEDGVFVGPHVCFTNDLVPRAINADASPKSADDWVLRLTHIKYGASLGANSTILCGLTVGEWAMVGSGSVLTKNVPAHGLVYGNPARQHGFICSCGEKLKRDNLKEKMILAKCPNCHLQIRIPLHDWQASK